MQFWEPLGTMFVTLWRVYENYKNIKGAVAINENHRQYHKYSLFFFLKISLNSQKKESDEDKNREMEIQRKDEKGGRENATCRFLPILNYLCLFTLQLSF